jgi:L-histidine N-alpha-methyltransferase
VQTHPTPSLARAVLEGLSGSAKSLPAFMLYDARGSALFEEITHLPEYYLTRAERAILVDQGHRIAARALALSSQRLDVLELGAGSAEKSERLLHALVARQGRTLFVPADLSREPLEQARARMRGQELLTVRPLLATHEQALRKAREFQNQPFVWFLGSSIGNYDDVEAKLLLEHVRVALGERGLLLLGADLKKDTATLIPAYDDAQGVTAAFNKNVLVRINRELGGHFDPTTFRHVALWNEQTSAVEMHLESLRAQRVRIDAIGLEVAFAAGERIHTESSHKYDRATIDGMLAAAGMRSTLSLCDPAGLYALHLATPSVASASVSDNLSG